MPLLDARHRPLKALRISVTDRCNFRCRYCMPRELFGASDVGEGEHGAAFLPKGEILHFEELERVARIFVALGVDKLRLTGGEPLLRQDLPDLVARLRRLDGLKDLALTTNGALLKELANPLKAAGLDRLTVSLDTLDPAKFARLNDTTVPLPRVLEGIEAARAAGFAPLKLNCVLQKGVNYDEILDLLQFAKDRGLVLRFIEFMDVGTLNGWKLDAVVPAAEVLATIRTRWAIEPVAEPLAGRVAERWKFSDGSGEFGVIASVSAPFCSGCDRARLSAEGKLYTCLFGSEGLDLKTALRNGASDADLSALLRVKWSRRDDHYSEIRTQETARNRKVEMFHIGG
ncbi:MAG: GTP 3',8-cyclase MoaA [Holophagaceae bacterium]|nr:GTP 3',8-cyclase MoaA [Holophagaceae bacterium]